MDTKACGATDKENFNNQIIMASRREFLKEAALGAAALTMGSSLEGFAAPRKGANASDRIRLGIVGVNSRGNALAQGFAKLPDCEITYICDCDLEAMARCQNTVSQITGRTPKGEQDIRKMLEKKDLDAVVIATPDHWHAPAAIMALQAGKHVYLEKPTSHNPAENEMLIRAAAKYKKCVQAGNQRRSWPNVIEGIQAVKSGEIGKVMYAKSWYVNNRPSIGYGKAVPVPEHLDWDLWQGPAPRTEFHDNYIHYNWHWFWRWGTGEALNNGTHFVDILRWGLGVDYPVMVGSIGGRYRYKDDWETPDTQLITFQFGDGKSGSWEGRSCNNYGVDGDPLGVAFYGENGVILFNGGNSYKVLDMKGNVIRTEDAGAKFDYGNLVNPCEELDQIHFKNWFDGIRKGSPLNSDVTEACISTQLVQLGNISQRVGRSLQVDPLSGRIVGDIEAQKLFGREYEPGWEPKI